MYTQSHVQAKPAGQQSGEVCAESHISPSPPARPLQSAIDFDISLKVKAFLLITINMATQNKDI